ncbi:hypothetical protein RvY_19038-1 [Ramazzottius varieornatus]|uniref:Peptidase S1 domain-containing protein n=1 Tax=Ramazzottius varieornatus TaxID=947166 RepID=A0A1D1W859_RAMVA|nr:hypothetical protein RvY_19038-1 [Ramazzottius varieornatus]
MVLSHPIVGSVSAISFSAKYDVEYSLAFTNLRPPFASSAGICIIFLPTMGNHALEIRKLIKLFMLTAWYLPSLSCEEKRCWGRVTAGVLSPGACYDISLKDDCVSSGYLPSADNCSDTSQFCCYGPLFYGTPTAAPLNTTIQCGVPFSFQSDALSTLAATSITIRSARQNRLLNRVVTHRAPVRRTAKAEVEFEMEDCSVVRVFQNGTSVAKGSLVNEEWILASIPASSGSTSLVHPADFLVGIRPVLQNMDMLLSEVAEVQVYSKTRPLENRTESSEWMLFRLVSAVELFIMPDVCVACLPEVKKGAPVAGQTNGRLPQLACLGQDVVIWIRQTVGWVYSAPQAPVTITPAPPTGVPFVVPLCNGKIDVVDTRSVTRGSFASHPYYPTLQTNPGVKHCRINVTASAGKVLRLLLAMNTLVNCKYEHLTIFRAEADNRLRSTSVCNPDLATLPQKGPFCRVNGSVSYYTPTNYAVIEYCREDTSRSVLQTAGFAVMWQVVEPATRPAAVPQIIPVDVRPGEPGNISTSVDRWFLGTYANNLDLTFVLTAPPGYFVRLWMSHSLEKNWNCLADYLVVTERLFVHGRYCGANFTRVTSRSKSISVRFVTDGAIQVGGFTLQYEASICGAGLIGCPLDPTRCLKPTELCDGLTQCPSAADEFPLFCGKLCGAAAIPPTLMDTNRIVGGSYVKPSSWPWQAALLDRKTGLLLCGGSLIQQRYVLTAGHCMIEVTNISEDVKEMRRRIPSDLLVVLGEHNIYSLLDQDKTETRSIQYILVHPSFNLTNPEVPPFDFQADLAILRLSGPVPYRPEISPVCLPKLNESPVPGRTCVATGWGSRRTKPPMIVYETVRAKRAAAFDPTPINSTVSYVLQQVALPVLSQKECAKQLSNSGAFGVLKDDMVCAGGTQGICNGDSGGPLVCQSAPNGPWVLQGVTSWTDGCGTVNRPGVFIRVARYVRWIEDMIRLLRPLP